MFFKVFHVVPAVFGIHAFHRICGGVLGKMPADPMGSEPEKPKEKNDFI